MEQTRTSPVLSYRRAKRNVLIAAAAFSAVLGPLWAFLDERGLQARLVDFVTLLGFSLLMLGWCYYDSLERGERLGAGFRLLLIFLGVLALFIYLLKSRGIGRGIVAVGVALLVCVGVALVAAASATAVGLAFGFM